jgi:hypothetical protein
VTGAASRRPGREPNFFIVGASRAGTTSLWDYLKQHPDVFFPAHPFPKEPSFFCDLAPVWGRPYRDLDSYLRGFEGARGKRAIGEASTTYLPSPESPGRIHARYPNARIIIILRNPADRAHSLYTLLCQLGFEWITPFERALAEEPVRMSDPGFKHDNPFWYYAYLYFTTGLYADQVERYLTTFPAPQVKVLLFESLHRRPRETAQEVYRFLDVDPTFVPNVTVQNQGSFPFWVRGQRMITRAWRTHPLKAAEGPPGLVDRLLEKASKANLFLGRRRAHGLRPSTRVELLRRYAPDILRTGSLIGTSLDAWVSGREVGQGSPEQHG